MPAVPFGTLTETAPGESSAFVRRRVIEATRRQTGRSALAGELLNARLDERAMARHCALDRAALGVLDAASRRFHLSARSCHRLMKVARTITDLAAAERITTDHLAEAVQFRLED